jgi:two-component system heavy metal sensor histidine kinase CusS
LEIRHKVTLQFSVLVAFLLLGILIFNYFLARNFAEESFFDRLRQRALSMAELEADLVPRQKMRGYNFGALGLPDELILAFDANGKKLFSIGSSRWPPDKSLIKRCMEQSIEEKLPDNRFVLSFDLDGENGRIHIVATARDEVGSSKLNNLARTMMLSFLLFLIFVVLAGQYLSRKALDPIQSVIRQVQQITARFQKLLRKP